MILNVEEDWDANIVGRKPAVYLSRQDVHILKIAINDMEQGGRLDGKQYFDVLIAGSHILKCYGLNSLPPDNLGFEVAMVLLHSASKLRNWLRLNQFRVTGMGKKTQDERDPQNTFHTPVAVPWAFWYRWVVTPSSPKLQFIDLAFFK